MKHTTLIEVSPEELKSIVFEAIREYDNSKQATNNSKSDLLLSRNKVRLKYGLTYSRIDKLIKSGHLIATVDNRINEQSVIDYKANKKSGF